jgi:excisionase family DNA binding protein
MTDPLLLTPTQAARALGIGHSKLYELPRSGALESVHIDTCRRIPTDALTSLVNRLRSGDAPKWRSVPSVGAVPYPAREPGRRESGGAR